MTDLPEPGDGVPEFLVDNFETEPARTLKAIAQCAHDSTKRQGVPEYARDAFAIQDDQTKAAVAEYAQDLGEFLEEEGYDTLEAVPKETYLNPSEVSDAEISESEDAEDDGGILGLF